MKGYDNDNVYRYSAVSPDKPTKRQYRCPDLLVYVVGCGDLSLAADSGLPAMCTDVAHTEICMTHPVLLVVAGLVVSLVLDTFISQMIRFVYARRTRG